MVIGIDIRALSKGIGGVPEYTRQIVHALIDTERTHQYILFSNSFRGDHGLALTERGPHHRLCQTHIPNKLFHCALAAAKRPHIDAIIERKTGMRPDLLFFPNIHFLAHRAHTPRVITVHDLSFEHAPDLLTAKDRLWHRMIGPRKMFAHAAHVLAVSEWTRRDIISRYHISEDRVTVTPLDSGIMSASSAHPRTCVMLFGGENKRKNADAVIEAWTWLRVRDLIDRHYTLVIVGRWRSDKHKALEHNHDPSIFFVDVVDENGRAHLYSRAAALLYPSIHEGFGIPLIEAARCRIPIITANTTSIGEVIGNGAYFVDPSNVHDVARALRDVLHDRELSDDLCEQALQHTAGYSWRHTAKLTREVFEKVTLPTL